MLLGGADEITDEQRCAEIADDLRAGGSPVRFDRLCRRGASNGSAPSSDARLDAI